MTIDAWDGSPATAGEVDVYDPNEFGGGALPGLESFDASRIAIPRLSIMHQEGRFLDGLTNEEFETMDQIILGMVTQRILWPKVMGDSDSPLCKSRDSHTGYPLLEPNGKAGLIFPFAESPFDADNMALDENGNSILACSSCTLKDWGKARGDVPWCSEQFTFIMCDPDGTGQKLFTVQKTGIAPAKRYITDFVRSNKPMFVCRTTLSLDTQRKGGPRGNVFSVPKFGKGEPVPREQWRDLADQLRNAQAFITTPPLNGNGRDGDGSVEAAMTSSTVSVAATRGAAVPAATSAAAAPLARPATPARVAPAAPATPPASQPFTPVQEEELPF